MRLNIKAAIFILSIFLYSCNGEKGKTDGSGEPAENHSENSSSSTTETQHKETPTVSGKTGYLIHLTQGPSDSYTTVLAMKTASDLSKHSQVVIYLDGKASELGLEATKEIEYSPFPPYKKTMKEMMDKGVPVLICEPCLQASWKKPEEVMKGIQIVKTGEFPGLDAERVITLDY